MQNSPLPKLSPDIEYEGGTYWLLTQMLTAMPAHLLKKPIGTIVCLSNIVIDAIDFAVTGV